MRVFWKLAITFGVLALFVFIFAFALVALMSSSDLPVLSGGEVSVIPVYGAIVMGGCPGGIFSEGSCADVETIKQQLRDADNDPSVKAIVLDIYSGGGNV
ncbi:MAG: hypothetical protein KKD39_07640, partial [Candidatus Altiarchaeota archaeon]|nr:hypothetical protein [Candidatus Altiarchaeota archaeon]